ncbi:hypothetical protein L3067_18290 [Xanthomonas sp. PPL568]|uniref:hypothetical protein n=1 Tax=Xanthomonas indica TaxID=2912242 RepID=UPI001F56525B|nr:hypothetical protein [Xanthomonas indica]MCI2246565.1 hypothetical protein [Xanthomonas indica]
MTATGASAVGDVADRDMAAQAEVLRGLPSQAQLWQWIERLNGFGPRLTGSPAHAAAIDFLATELQALGLQVQRDHLPLRRWTAHATHLTLDDGSAIAVAAPLPYSGTTAPDGLAGELVWFDGRPRSFRKARGKIAVVVLRRRDLDRTLLTLAFKRKARLPDGDADFTESPITTPLLTGLQAVALDKARRQGVRAVICVFEGVSEAQLQGQILPFTTPYRDLPAVWVCERHADALRAAAAQRRQARLTLHATLQDTTTDTLYAVLPGRAQDETIIVNTHTDGPNACEENGAAGVLALAHAFAALPRAARRRTLLFVLVTGHFQLPQIGVRGRQATSAWLQRHPQLWDGHGSHARAVAGITIEHLGCTEWRDDLAAGTPAPTGKLERDLVYTATPALDALYRQACAGRSKLRALTLSPRLDVAMLGEGQPLYQAGIPVVANCPIPDYLCQVLPDGGIARLDPGYAQQQVETFARLLAQLDHLDAAQIGRIPFTPGRLLSRLIERLR